MKIVYNYHPVTLEYMGSIEAAESPLEPGVYLIPANATEIAPPAKQDGNIRVFKDGKWGYVRIETPSDPNPTPEPQEPPIPATISKRQFWQQLANMGMITKAEALAVMVSGTLPPAFDALVSALDEDDEFKARMQLATNDYERSNEYVAAFAQAQDIDDATVDEIWKQGATL